MVNKGNSTKCNLYLAICSYVTIDDMHDNQHTIHLALKRNLNFISIYYIATCTIPLSTNLIGYTQ